jgi:hypothetical protein
MTLARVSLRPVFHFPPPSELQRPFSIQDAQSHVWSLRATITGV